MPIWRRAGVPVRAEPDRLRRTVQQARHFAPSDAPRPPESAHGPGAWSGSAAAGCAASPPALLRAPPVPSPFAAGGRAVRCRERTFDTDHPGRSALRAAGLHRLGPRPRPPHPPPVPRTARRRTEDRRHLRRRHQRRAAPTAQPRPGAVLRDHDQPQPRRPVPAHTGTVLMVPGGAHSAASGQSGVENFTAVGALRGAAARAAETGVGATRGIPRAADDLADARLCHGAVVTRCAGRGRWSAGPPHGPVSRRPVRRSRPRPAPATPWSWGATRPASVPGR